MVPISGAIDVDIPAAALWAFFSKAHAWPRWNACFLWVHNRELALGDQLKWCFGPIKRFYPYVMPAVAKIVELVPGSKVTWEVSALPGFYAHHTYSVEPLPNGRARFRSWEKAYGPSFRATKDFWLAHFSFVKDRSLEGARLLEDEYRKYGTLDALLRPPAWRSKLADALFTTTSAALPVWFYDAYIKQSAEGLAPGITAVIGGGGNSLVVQGKREALLVDSKFPPGSRVLQRWIKKRVSAPIRYVVNTHYHYDHAQGNDLYPGAEIMAHELAPALMLGQDGQHWARNLSALPTRKVPSTGERLRVDDLEVVLEHPGHAHTRADLVVYVPKYDVLATGDLFFHTYYPFFDLSKAGASIEGLISALEKLAIKYPTATVVPGHGPVAKSADLRGYAAYLDALRRSAVSVIERGGTEEEAAQQAPNVERSILPSFHHGQVSWATKESAARSVFRLVLAERRERDSEHPATPVASTQARADAIAGGQP
jgi:glyoxylase-like metal-dependent hydrolase (beta-lactamase superfamily II)